MKRSIIYGIVIITLTEILGLALVYLYIAIPEDFMVPVVFLLFPLSLLVIIAVLFRKKFFGEKIILFALLIGMIVSFWGNFWFIYPLAGRYLASSEAIGVSVADAARYQRAAVFRFSDGRPMPQRRGTAEERRRTKSGISYLVKTHYAVPVVPDGWRVGDPVQIWIAQSDRLEPMTQTRWSRRPGFVLAHPRDGRYHTEAIADAAKSGIRAGSDAVVLAESDDPAGEKRGVVLYALMLFIIPKFLWAVMVRLWGDTMRRIV